MGARAEAARIFRAGGRGGELGYLSEHQSVSHCLPKQWPLSDGPVEEGVGGGLVPTLTQQATPTGPAGSSRDGEGGIFGARQDDWAVSKGPERWLELMSQLSLTTSLVPTGHPATQMKDSSSRQGIPGGRLGWAGERPVTPRNSWGFRHLTAQSWQMEEAYGIKRLVASSIPDRSQTRVQ